MRALLSVANREGIAALARDLPGLERRDLRNRRHARVPRRGTGIEVASVAELTDSQPTVGGQVKTFHHAVYAGILARRDVPEQMDELKPQGIAPIDLVDRQRQAVRAGDRRQARRDRRGDRDDRRRRRGAARRGRPQRGGRRRGLRPVALRRRSSSELREHGQVSRRDAGPARGRGVQHGRRVPRRDRGLPQPDLGQHVPQPARAWSSRRSTTCATARTRTSAPRSTARRPTASRDARRRDPAPGRQPVVQQPARPRRRVRDRPRLHGARPSRSSSTPTRSGWRRTTSSSRRTGMRSRPIRSRRSAGSSA